MSNPTEAAPTVESNPILSVKKSAALLRKAMRQKDPDQETIILLITSCSNDQRHEMAKAYYVEYRRNLEKDLRRRLCGNLESLIVGLIYPPTDYFARQLNKAMRGLDVDANTIIEVFVTQSDAEIKEIARHYEKAFSQSLVEHLRSKTSGDFKKLLTLILTTPRAPEVEVSINRAQQVANELLDAVQTKNQITIADIIVDIFAHESYQQLRLMFEEYKELANGVVIEEMLKSQLSGNLLKLTQAMVEFIHCPVAYFAKQLHKAVSGAKTDDQTLIRIIVTRSEIDLVAIKKEYKRLFEKGLKKDIKEATTGNYQNALLQLIGSS